MELEEFITTSILQIHSGLKTVNKELTKGYSQDEKKNLFLLMRGSDKNKGEGIHFDLAITTKTETTNKKDAKARIWVVEGGLGQENNVVKENISRISFTVHVTRPAGTYHDPPSEREC